MRTLRQSLLDCDMAFLDVIARRWGLVLESHQREEVLGQLESALLRPESVAATLAELSSQERAALDALLIAGGRMPEESFVRAHGPMRPVGPGRLRREEPWRQPVSGAEGLWYRALIFRGVDLESHKGPMVPLIYVASDLLPLLPSPEKAPSRLVVAPVPPPTQQSSGSVAFRQDVCSFLIYLHHVEVRPGPKQTLPRRHQEQLLAMLLEETPGRLHFIEHLAWRLDLIEARRRRLRLNAPQARAWLRTSPARQLQTLQ